MPQTSNTTSPKVPNAPATSEGDTVMVWLFMGLFVFGIYSAYCAIADKPNEGWTVLVENGWASRVHRSSVVADASWLVGEYKDCSSVDPSTPVYLTCGLSGVLGREMDVRFYGLVSTGPAEPLVHNWKCKKTNESNSAIECRMSR